MRRLQLIVGLQTRRLQRRLADEEIADEKIVVGRITKDFTEKCTIKDLAMLESCRGE